MPVASVVSTPAASADLSVRPLCLGARAGPTCAIEATAGPSSIPHTPASSGRLRAAPLPSFEVRKAEHWNERHGFAAPLVTRLSSSAGHSTWRGRRPVAEGRRSRAGRPSKPQRGTKTAPLQRRDADGWCARGHGRQRPSGKERGKSARGSARRCRTLTARSRGRVRPPQSRSIVAARQGRPRAIRSAHRAEALGAAR